MHCIHNFSIPCNNILVIPGINYATKGTAYQKSTYSGDDSKYSARFAIDGIIDSSFSNTEQSTTGEWWKVDLGRKVIFQFARIFARTDDCNGNPCGTIFTLITKLMIV